MAKQKKAKKKQRKKQNKPRVPRDLLEAAETRSATSATVAWTLALISTIAAEVIGFLCTLYTKFINTNDLLTVLGAIMLFVALVAGVMTLILIPVVLKLSKQRPPTPIVQAAWLAGLLPVVVITVQYFSK